jgi:biopolymer transport protein ExbD
MAGVDTSSGGSGGRRTGNFEINMIPMIDLLMVTISFLLITAVWTNMSRMKADAQVPGPPRPCEDSECCDKNCPQEKRLHVSTIDGQKFVLEWKEGANVISTSEVEVHVSPAAADKNGGTRFPELSAAIAKEWKTGGVHRVGSDMSSDRAVIHSSNDLPYSTLVGVMDSVSTPRRAQGKNPSASAFDVSFAMN